MNEQEKRSISKAGIGYTIGNYLIRGLGFLTLPIFTHLLSTADYGIYNNYNSYESIMFIFVGLALHTSFKNARLKFTDDFYSYISSCILLILMNTLLFLLGGNVICSILGIKKHMYLTILIIHSFATAIIAYYNTYLSIYFRSRSYIKLSFLNALGNISLSIILILTVFNNDRAYGRIVGSFIPCFVISIILVLHFWKRSNPNVLKKHWNYALRYSLPLIPHGISQVLLSSFDRIMITKMIGASEAGIYSFAFNVYAIISITYSSLDQVWSPWFYEKMNKGKSNEIKDCAFKYAFGMALFTIGIMFIAPEIAYYLGTKAYYDSINLLVPVILGGFFSYLYSFPAIIEYYHEKTKYIALGTMGAAVINVVLNYIFISKFGYIAAVYTTLVTYVLYFVFHYVISICINKGKIYELKHFIIIIVLVTSSGVLTQVLIPYMWVRWLLGIADAIVLFVFLNSQLNIIEYFRKQLINK